MKKKQPKSYLDWSLGLEAQNPHMAEAVFPNAPIRKPDYNYGLAFLNDPKGQLAANGHLSDIGKMPNHPTFSNESAYGIGNNKAGQWIEPLNPSGDWQYHNPSKGMLYAPEDAAYQQPTSGMAALSRIWNALNQR